MKFTVLINILLLYGLTSIYANECTLRKYNHVKKFYSEIILDTIAISKQNNLPAASILAIAGLESGYGSGYVSKITGNILSLGAFENDKELPALYLPYSKSKKKVLFDSSIIANQPKEDLIYKLRSKSYKHDYRPKYAGTITNLNLLKNDAQLRKQANKRCLEDFSTRWINTNSNIKVFKNAKRRLNSMLKSTSTSILYAKNTNTNFINKIGGVPNSFNYRKSWPKKVLFIMQRTGLVKLVVNIEKNNLSFDEAWKEKDCE